MKKLLFISIVASLLMVLQAQVPAFHTSECICDACHSQYDDGR